MARPRKHLPPGAKEYILQCASDSSLQPTKICRALGMSYRAFTRVLRDNDDAAALWVEAKAIERDAIVQRLYERALEGDVQASRILLAVRHGMNEKGTTDDGNQSRVVINLPGSMDAKQYQRLIEVEQSEQQEADALEVGRG